MKKEMRLFATESSCFSCRPAILALVVSMFLATSAVAQQLTFYSADAYGATAYVGNTVSVAGTADVNFGDYCGIYQLRFQRSGTSAGVSVPLLLTTGVTTTNVANAPELSTASSEVHGISILNGLVTSDVAKSVSTTTFGGIQNFNYSSAGSSFANLRVLGLPINYTPAPNTTIALPGIGKVVLNEQITNSIYPGNIHFSVNMLHVYITLPNLLGIPLGTEVIVSGATSGITLINGIGAVDGIGYGSTIMGSLVQSSATAKIYLPCGGTNGVVTSESIAGINVPGVLNTGTITTTVVGDVRAFPVTTETTSTIQGASLLGTLIKASVIQAKADGTTSDNVNLNFSASGQFVGLSVSGHPEINDNVANNTTVPLLGLGTLYIRRIIPDPNNIHIEMRMLELVISQRNLFGLPIGTDIILGSAEASLHPGPTK
jgi:hypothetical protein